MNKQKNKNAVKQRRKNRVRAKIFGTAKCPRLSVFRSNKYIFAQLVDDKSGKTLASIHSKEVKADKKETKTDIAFATGKLLGKKAKEKKILEAVFDRGAYLYHGRVKALADGAREAGLKF